MQIREIKTLSENKQNRKFKRSNEKLHLTKEKKTKNKISFANDVNKKKKSRNGKKAEDKVINREHI